ncbi:ATP-binding protein [Streptomyces sp. NBC_01387]|uniref:ATP-binding protein n=1 Tax=unclassified Streptomyces TaxID=2593676 RepID=UPI0020246664|nr:MULTISPECIES: ATP-binding protein [unclassified Streptomyces]MCX4548470.1 ATP-binding protein [Streptomyces sp. NBC_01500]WSC20087.1 ATP-binding protein [Streptomyces sp. NBC_01766]WSV54108.1 ATP-binding protein [Streptomyces sp. NBC_01014]
MSGLIGTEGGCAQWTFPAEPGAVRVARRAVRDTLRTWELHEPFGDIAVLLVSELVTNSLRHATGPIGVRVARLDQAGLRVEVSDPLPDPPRERSAGPDDEGGRGIQLVACSAQRWGTQHGRSGKTVWFELAQPG